MVIVESRGGLNPSLRVIKIIMFAAEKKYLFVLVALIIIAALALHMVTFSHEHHLVFFGELMITAVHGEDKKLWLTFLLFVIFAAGCLRMISRSHNALAKFSRNTFNKEFLLFDLLKLFDPLRIAFRRGILHSKIFA